MFHLIEGFAANARLSAATNAPCPAGRIATPDVTKNRGVTKPGLLAVLQLKDVDSF
jgi:hypothetical protein